jgi:hypothetical protein
MPNIEVVLAERVDGFLKIVATGEKEDPPPDA